METRYNIYNDKKTIIDIIKYNDTTQFIRDQENDLALPAHSQPYIKLVLLQTS